MTQEAPKTTSELRPVKDAPNMLALITTAKANETIMVQRASEATRYETRMAIFNMYGQAVNRAVEFLNSNEFGKSPLDIPLLQVLYQTHTQYAIANTEEIGR